jgi:hypothetical protein
VSKIKFLSIIVVVTLVLSIGISAAQAQRAGPEKQQLTSEEMTNAIVVASTTAPRPGGPGAVYRLASCDPQDQKAPCYFTVSGGGNFAKGQQEAAIGPMSSGATLVCGQQIYNGIGQLAAVFQQNVNVTFWGTYGRSPVTLNWGDLRGTNTYLMSYAWNSLSGPTPNPSWGTRTSGTAYTIAGGNLVYNPIPGYYQTIYVSSRLTINTSGWYCQ